MFVDSNYRIEMIAKVLSKSEYVKLKVIYWLSDLAKSYETDYSNKYIDTNTYSSSYNWFWILHGNNVGCIAQAGVHSLSKIKFVF